MRWSGNKSRYLKHIIPHLPPLESINTYIEPFLGSGALFLFLKPKQWIINDLNKELINIWQTVKNDPAFIRHVFLAFGKQFLKVSSLDEKLLFCRGLLKKMENMPYDSNRASLYLLLKYCAFMGFIFIDNTYKFTALDTKIYNGKSLYFLSNMYFDNIFHVSEFLSKNVKKNKILNDDYKNVLKKAKSGDFVFLDPPYVEDDINYHFNYNRDENIDDLFIVELSIEVKKLDEQNIKWLMTQADTAKVRDIFKRYDISTFQVYRRQSKTYKNELLIKNY